MKHWACIIAGVLSPLLMAGVVSAIEPEDGPAFMTDTHGAAGVCWFLEDLRVIDPAFDRYYFGGLDWLVDTAQWEDDRCGWWVSVSAPDWHPNHKFTTGGGAIFSGLAKGYAATGDPRYATTAIGGIRATMDTAIEVDTPYGTGYWWGKRVGHSHGPGSVGDMLINAHDLLDDEEVVPYLHGLFNWLRHAAVASTDQSGNLLLMWPEQPGGTAYETGYCYGNAGTLAFVIKAANHFPDFRYPDGMSLHDIVNANLRWLMSVAVDVPQAGGVVWRYMRHQEVTTNIGWGSGVSGIGARFLEGYDLNKAAGDPFADECLAYAKMAAASVVYKANNVSRIQRGACGGEGGAPWFLLPLADTLEAEGELEAAQACRDASGRLADMVVEDSMSFNGRTAWKSSDKFGDEAVNIALDYGVTGLGWALYQVGVALDRPDLLQVARTAGDYLRLITVWEEDGGCKWPQIVPYGPGDVDRDGVFNSWDAFPVKSGEAVDSDGDAMGDHFEWRIIDHDAGDPLATFWDVLPHDDYDGDTADNLAEFKAGTDPTDPDSVPGGGCGQGSGLAVASAALLALGRRKGMGLIAG